MEYIDRIGGSPDRTVRLACSVNDHRQETATVSPHSEKRTKGTTRFKF